MANRYLILAAAVCFAPTLLAAETNSIGNSEPDLSDPAFKAAARSLSLPSPQALLAFVPERLSGIDAKLRQQQSDAAAGAYLQGRVAWNLNLSWVQGPADVPGSRYLGTKVTEDNPVTQLQYRGTHVKGFPAVVTTPTSKDEKAELSVLVGDRLLVNLSVTPSDDNAKRLEEVAGELNWKGLARLAKKKAGH